MAFAASVDPYLWVVSISTSVFNMSRASCRSASGGSDAAGVAADSNDPSTAAAIVTYDSFIASA